MSTLFYHRSGDPNCMCDSCWYSQGAHARSQLLSIASTAPVIAAIMTARGVPTRLKIIMIPRRDGLILVGSSHTVWPANVATVSAHRRGEVPGSQHLASTVGIRQNPSLGVLRGATRCPLAPVPVAKRPGTLLLTSVNG